MARLHTLLKFVFIVLAALLGAVGARAQGYRVESFEIVPKDLSARTEGLVDANGRKCAVVKVYVKDAITDVDGPMVGEVRDRGMEKWVYVMHDAKRLRLLFKEHMPLDLTFADYDYPTLTGQMTYVLKLTEATPVANNVTPVPQPHPTPQPTPEPTLTPARMCEKGKDAYKSQNYAEALSWFRKAADQGNAQAQCSLGYMYNTGRGVAQDYAEAVRWYRNAADQGDAIAQYNLGVMYDNGTGVNQNYAEAVNWFRKAANQGNANAQCHLGSMYYNGTGVDKDLAKAREWWEKAAAQGNPTAKSNLERYF